MAVPQVFGVVTTVRVIREGFRTRAVLGFSMDLFWLSARGHKNNTGHNKGKYAFARCNFSADSVKYRGKISEL